LTGNKPVKYPQLKQLLVMWWLPQLWKEIVSCKIV